MTCRARLEALLGAAVLSIGRLTGGDLSTVSEVTLTDGRRLIAKESATAREEGAMLESIRATGCPAPSVVVAECGLLVMERLADGGPPGPVAWEAAGRAIRRLHDARGEAYGWRRDHAFGTVAIPNALSQDWPGFWAERRLLAGSSGLPSGVARRLERLAAALPDRLPATPPPAFLHGDLWSGNLLFGPAGFSEIIDPAAYFGHAEVDLAMLSLFGRPPSKFFEGYGALEDGWEMRRPIYQLWPALVHLRLFGAGYRAMVEGLLARTVGQRNRKM